MCVASCSNILKMKLQGLYTCERNNHEKVIFYLQIITPIIISNMESSNRFYIFIIYEELRFFSTMKKMIFKN